MLVEVCANSVESALAGQRAGAGRIELCSELAVGGITPSAGLLELVREQVRIPVRVLIRPRSGDFCYSEPEFEAMLRDIRHCASLGFEGVVSGCLMPDGSVDEQRTAALITAAGKMGFTFHRAFDRCPDPYAALAALESLGADTILSSGQAATAPEGLDLLKALQQKAVRCRFMPGGGINANNVSRFAGQGFGAVHLSGIPKGASDAAYHGPPMNSPDLLREGAPPRTDPRTVAAVVRVLKANG